MTQFGPEDVLFIGLGRSVPCWYRIALPASALGSQWIGAQGHPPDEQIIAGNRMSRPEYASYRAVIIQQPYGRRWLDFIRGLRADGVKVIYEIDDFLHGVSRQEGHSMASHFTRERLRDSEMCMSECDAVISSTSYLAKRMEKFNQRSFTCRNGLDLGRYRVTRPRRSSVHVGWAGAGDGHSAVVGRWVERVGRIMRAREDVNFVSIGYPAGADLAREFPARTTLVPWTTIESFPAALANIDIGLAPAEETEFYRGKSDLRQLEYGALGIPTIGHPLVYDQIEDGVSGRQVVNSAQMGRALEQMLDDPEGTEVMGEYARRYVEQERSAQKVVGDWIDVLEEVVS